MRIGGGRRPWVRLARTTILDDLAARGGIHTAPPRGEHVTKILGQLNHADGSASVAIADNHGQAENDGKYRTVVYFPEPGGEYEIAHDVPNGTGDGEFCS